MDYCSLAGLLPFSWPAVSAKANLLITAEHNLITARNERYQRQTGAASNTSRAKAKRARGQTLDVRTERRRCESSRGESADKTAADLT